MHETFFYRGKKDAGRRGGGGGGGRSANEDKGDEERRRGGMKTLPPTPFLIPPSPETIHGTMSRAFYVFHSCLEIKCLRRRLILRGFLWRRLINEASAISGCSSSLVEKFRWLVSHVALRDIQPQRGGEFLKKTWIVIRLEFSSAVSEPLLGIVL